MSAKALAELDRSRSRGRFGRRRRPWSALSRTLRARRDRRRIERLRLDPHTARDLGLTPAEPDPAPPTQGHGPLW